MRTEHPQSGEQKPERERVRRRSGKKRSGTKGSSPRLFTANVKCRHCGVRYRTNLFSGRCPKCSCALRNSVEWWDLLLSLFVPLYGIARTVLVWGKSPLGALQILFLGALNTWACYNLYHWISVRY